MDEKFIGEKQPTPEVETVGVGSLVSIKSTKDSLGGYKYLATEAADIEDGPLLDHIKPISLGTPFGAAINKQQVGEEFIYTSPSGSEAKVVISAAWEVLPHQLLGIDKEIGELLHESLNKHKTNAEPITKLSLDPTVLKVKQD